MGETLDYAIRLANGEFVGPMRQSRAEVDKTERSARELDDELQDVKRSSDKIDGAGPRRLGSGISGAVAGVAQLVSVAAAGRLAGEALSRSISFEAQRAGLEAVTGSGAETERQLRRLREVAASPGLGFREALAGSVNLQAAGFSARMAEESLMAYGNALASVGRGKAELDGVTTALAQMAAKGSVSAEEINQIAERVPQVRQAMKDAFGTATAEDINTLGISVEDFVDGLNSALGALPQAASTMANELSNLEDQWDQTLTGIGDQLKPIAGLMLSMTQMSLDKFAPGGDSSTSPFSSADAMESRVRDQLLLGDLTGNPAEALEEARTTVERFIQLLEDASGIDFPNLDLSLELEKSVALQSELNEKYDGAAEAEKRRADEAARAAEEGRKAADEAERATKAMEEFRSRNEAIEDRIGRRKYEQLPDEMKVDALKQRQTDIKNRLGVNSLDSLQRVIDTAPDQETKNMALLQMEELLKLKAEQEAIERKIADQKERDAAAAERETRAVAEKVSGRSNGDAGDGSERGGSRGDDRPRGRSRIRLYNLEESEVRRAGRMSEADRLKQNLGASLRDPGNPASNAGKRDAEKRESVGATSTSEQLREVLEEIAENTESLKTIQVA